MHYTTERMPWQTVVLQSTVLQGNPLGDPSLRQFPVYLPPTYNLEPERRFPVVYYLAGYGGWGAMKLLEEKAFDTPLWMRLDRLMNSSELEPMLLVFVDGFTRFGGAQYRNSIATGRYADYVADELVRAIDQQFRTQAVRDARAIMGKSSGGYGALHLAMTRPEIFGLCCATAADSHFGLSYMSDFGKALQAFRAAGGPAAFVQGFFAGEKRHPHWMSALMVIAMAQCYSPNLQVPVYFADLPFDCNTGALNEAVWQRWLACDPVQACAMHVDALKSLKLLFLDAGRSDEWFLDFGHRRLAQELGQLGIAFEIEEFDGGHMGIDHRIDQSLARVTQRLRSLV